MPLLFNEEVEKLFQSFGRADDLKSIHSCYIKLISWEIPNVIYGNPNTITERDRARCNFQTLIQGLLQRSISLIRVSPYMIENTSVHGLALITRGHLESTAQLGYFCDRLVAFEKGNITEEELQDKLANTLMGAAHPQFKEAPKPLNIMLCIEKADRHFRQCHGNEKGELIKDCYGWLSEFCHPNYLSSKSSYQFLKQEHSVVFRHDVGFTMEDSEIIGYLAISCGLFEVFYSDALNRVEILDE